MTVQTYEIHMPHRHSVEYTEGESVLIFEVEPVADGIVFYSSDYVVKQGKTGDVETATQRVETWLNRKFGSVEIDTSPKPTF